MGLLDAVVGMLGKKQGGALGNAAALLPLVTMLVGQKGQSGGLGQILSQLQNSGLQEQVGSWLGNGANQQVSGQQLQDALGSDMLGQLAGQLGMGQGDVAGQLANMLPGLVDKVSPNGQVDADGLDPSDLMGMLGGLMK